MAFRLPRRTVSRLDRLAKRAGRSRSELLREAVEAYIANMGPLPGAAEPSGPGWSSGGEGVRAPETLARVVRAGVRALQTESFAATTFSMGEPRVPSLDKSLRIAAALEDEETARKLSLKK